MTFAETLSTLRKANKLKIVDVARGTGLTPGHVSRLEKGLRNPSEEVVRRIAAALGSSSEEADQLLDSAGFGAVSGSAGATAPDPRGQQARGKEIQAASAKLLAEGLSLGDARALRAFDQALEELTALRRSLLSPVREAVVPLAGGQHRLLAQHAVQRLMITAAAEAFAAGIARVVFVVAPESEEAIFGPLQNVFALMAKHYWEFNCVVQEKPTGLGDAVLCARAAVSEERFAVLLPDDVIHTGIQGSRRDDLPHMIRIASEDSCDAVLAGIRLPRSLRHGGVAVLGPEKSRLRVWPVTQLVEKPGPDHPAMASPNCVSVVGRYVLSRRIFAAIDEIAHLKAPKTELTDAIELVRGQGGKVWAWQLEGERIDVSMALDEAGRAVLLG